MIVNIIFIQDIIIGDQQNKLLVDMCWLYSWADNILHSTQSFTIADRLIEIPADQSLIHWFNWADYGYGMALRSASLKVSPLIIRSTNFRWTWVGFGHESLTALQRKSFIVDNHNRKFLVDKVWFIGLFRLILAMGRHWHHLHPRFHRFCFLMVTVLQITDGHGLIE